MAFEAVASFNFNLCPCIFTKWQPHSW